MHFCSSTHHNCLARDHDPGARRLHRIDVFAAALLTLLLREQQGQPIVAHQILPGEVEIGQQEVDVAGGRCTALAVGHGDDVHHRKAGQLLGGVGAECRPLWIINMGFEDA